MILPFSTQLNGKPTYFVCKIFKGIKRCLNYESYYNLGRDFTDLEMLIPYDIDSDIFHDVKPKFHTIRLAALRSVFCLIRMLKFSTKFKGKN